MVRVSMATAAPTRTSSRRAGVSRVISVQRGQTTTPHFSRPWPTNDFDKNIDVDYTRIAFGAVDGLTKNQSSAGDGIEKTYNDIDEGSDDYKKLIASLFTLDDGEYQQFLDQLTGAEYAQQLQSVLWSTKPLNWIIGGRLEKSGSEQSAKLEDGSNVVPVADVPDLAPGRGRAWVRGYGSRNSLDGNDEAPGYDEQLLGIVAGYDYAFSDDWFGGLAVGYMGSEMDFDNWGGRSGASVDYSGWQLAAYGGYDDSVLYARGILAAGWYDGDSSREVDNGPDPGTLEGSPDSHVYSFYGEAGWRYAMTATATLTPYAGLNLATATLEGFTEDDDDGTGAALSVDDSDGQSVETTLGLRFEAPLPAGDGILTPALSAAWLHEFGDTVQTVNMGFNGAPPGTGFEAISSEVARNSILLDAGASDTIGASAEMGLYYTGRFSEDYSVQAVTARFSYRF